MSDEETFIGLDMFHEEELPLPDPVYQSFTRLNGETLTLRLVGQSPLWGHLLWSAGKIMANYLDCRKELIHGKNVLELGAASALPSLICALNGARKVIATDYPDTELIENIQYNIGHCSGVAATQISSQGYIWGREVGDLLCAIDHQKFDLLLLSDLVFNHQAHHDLLKTCMNCMASGPDVQALVFFTHHRPHLAHKDNDFLTLAAAEPYNFLVEKVAEDKSEQNVMFEEDGGSRDVRATVHGYRLTRSTNVYES